MKISDEISNEIWSEPMFHQDMWNLESANIEFDLFHSRLIEEYTRVSPEVVRRLLQCALIFSDASQEHFLKAAQKISTALVRLSGLDDKCVYDVFSLIQSRLRNFPALGAGRDGGAPPRSAPLSLQYEFLDARSRHSVNLSDGTVHVFTKFQLESWLSLTSKGSTALSGPTSAGKSFVILLYLVELFRLRKSLCSLYIVPTRALINQVSADAMSEFSKHGVNDVSIVTAPIDVGKASPTKILYVLTQERVEALLNNNQEFTFDVVIVDEAQIISDGSRGVLLESVIGQIFSRNRNTQVVFCGPMIENLEFFNSIFDVPDFAICNTTQSPVTQKLIYLDYSTTPKSNVSVSIMHEGKKSFVSSVPVPAKLRSDSDRISYLSFLFGRGSSNIVYTSGKADAEKIAVKICSEMPEMPERKKSLAELINFVKIHVHRDYALASCLEKGIAFHYGHMPTILRKELEDAFQGKKISYIVCTSTLLYGMNLPAKNIFLLRPTTGRGSAISSASFWNLAGRVGRLGKESEGNVYIIDYERWDNSPAQEKSAISITSALKTAVTEKYNEFIEFMANTEVESERMLHFEISLGKLVVDYRKNELESTLSRYATTDQSIMKREIAERISHISNEIDIPTDVLSRNISISVYRQRDLLDFMLDHIGKSNVSELIPNHPLDEFEEVNKKYQKIFKIIHTQLLRYPEKDRSHYFFSPLALKWMRGVPLPVLIDSSIEYYRRKKQSKSNAYIIRQTMENVEKHLRFRYVKLFNCYNSLLELALHRANRPEYIGSIPQLPLFLEMGASSGVMINLMALGFSRVTAESLSEYINDKDLGIEQTRQKIAEMDINSLDLSPICIREILSLIKKAA